ncbi:MAG: hypothetical protein LAP21_10640 [Acidobacteriia bacterium]|nr:hypothetical protein [Terriglobia bacterium]
MITLGQAGGNQHPRLVFGYHRARGPSGRLTADAARHRQQIFMLVAGEGAPIVGELCALPAPD